MSEITLKKPEFVVTEGTKLDYDYIDDKRVEKTLEGFYSPCGQFFPEMQTKYEHPLRTDGKPNYDADQIETKYPITMEDVINEHCLGEFKGKLSAYGYYHNHNKNGCIECKIISGFSHATVMTQDNVANLFGLGKDGLRSGSDNFRSENGILIHYRTIQSIRLKDGTVINNAQCWSRGFAHCSTPRNAKFSMDLSTLSAIVGRYDNAITNINILEHDDENDRTLFNYVNNDKTMRYFLNAGNEGNRRRNNRFIVELIKPCNTIAEALDSMKPREARLAEAQGLKVQRQGELFFIPLSNQINPLQITDTEKREKSQVTVFYGECKHCGIKTEDFDSEDDWRIDQHPQFYSWRQHRTNPKIQKAIKCYSSHKEPDKLMVTKSKVKGKFSAFPIIEVTQNNRRFDYNHMATEVGKQFGFTTARGIVRHRNNDHPKVYLGNQWHYVVPNLVTQALSTDGGVD
jgi:hypothetical protein